MSRWNAPGTGLVLRRKVWPVGLAMVALSTAACGGIARGAKAGAPATTTQSTLLAAGGTAQSATPAGQGAGGAGRSATRPGHAAGGTLATVPTIGRTGGDTCSQPQHVPTVQGDPRVSSVPAISSVSLVPTRGGLGVEYRFARRLLPPPEGVYYSWTIWLYRHRSDAAAPTRAIDLQVEDRGAGWEPSGWAISASTYTDNTPVAGQVAVNPEGTQLTTFFPPGFVDLKPPFYWYASQQEYRAYLPTKAKSHNQDFSVNGTITIDCPSGIRQSPYSLPVAARLLGAS